MVSRIAERRPLGALGRMSLVAAIHVAVLFGIMRSMGISVMPAPEQPPDIVTTFEKAQPTTPVEKLPTYVVPKESFVAPLEKPPTADFEQDTITELPPDAGFIGTETEGDNTPQPVIESVRPDPRHPLTRPEYSPRMIREGNQGNIDLEVYVLPDGRVGDARVVKST